VHSPFPRGYKASYGACLCLAFVLAAIAAPAQTFKTLASFRFFKDGGSPQYMTLVQGADGDLYGTTALLAEVFKIGSGGGLTKACNLPGCVGAYSAGLILANDGNFYGTSWQGDHGGVVYQLTPGGVVNVVYNFCSEANCADGGEPFSPVIQAANLQFYGTTFDGGDKGYGTVYAVDYSGAFTRLHSFSFKDGAGPVGGLAQAKNGNFYGTTLYGGAHSAGTVFEITAARKFTTLYSFCSQKRCGDGSGPYAGLVQASDGSFYGTTRDGGAYGHGTLFRITAVGKLTTLYSFCSQKNCADGAEPYAGVIQATDGNFYGVTSKGGANNWGTIFRITRSGELTTLHSFCSLADCTDGAEPIGGLLQASNGDLYGTTAEGGADESGTVFRLSLSSTTSAEEMQPGRDVTVKSDEETSSRGDPEMRSMFEARHQKALQFDPWGLFDDVGESELVEPTRPHQSAPPPGPVNRDVLTCSPAPCVLPPTQASEGGSMVTDSPIAANPINPKELLLGSVDFNCYGNYDPGFHLSDDGGSSWQRVLCMPNIITKQGAYEAEDEPSVGYDRNGTAFAAAPYFCCNNGNLALIGVQRSSDGVHWSKPVIAMREPGKSLLFETSMAVDVSPYSPRVNSVYVSAVMGRKKYNQVLVSHSTDGGSTWVQAGVDPMQVFPALDDLTRLAVGEDGTVYVTWMHCPGTGLGKFCDDDAQRLMFSESTDGGNTWSAPRHIATAVMPPYDGLPHTLDDVRVYNYPAIKVDISNGSHSGNLYIAMYSWTGTHMQVEVIRSTDGGNTWSQPAYPAPKSDTHDQFFPAISVSSTGKVGVSWLDRRNDPANHDYQAFAAISTDGGQSFGKNWQLTQAFSDPDVNGTGNWMGDYTGNTWRDDNTFIAAWMDSSNGVDMQEVVGGVRLK